MKNQSPLPIRIIPLQFADTTNAERLISWQRRKHLLRHHGVLPEVILYK